MSRDATPLPEFACCCPHKQMGQHLTTCKPARIHEATPLRERPGYEEGRPYRCVTWNYPTRITVPVHLEIEVDLPAYIQAHRKAYDAYEMGRGYEDWEKPMVWFSSLIEEAAGDMEAALWGDRPVISVRADVDHADEYPRWSPEDTERIPPPIDPNQGDLFEQAS